MPNFDKLIRMGEDEIENSSSRFEKRVNRIEPVLVNELRKLFKSIDVSGGKISTNQKTIEFISSLENRIKKALLESGYNDGVKELLKSFDVIKTNNIALQSVTNNLNIIESSLTGVQRIEVQNTITNLLGSGLDASFVNPLREALFRNITLGGTIADAEKIIEEAVISNPNRPSNLSRYIGQVARDSISQFDGAIQAKIGDELGLNDFLYAGSIIVDSRAQCIHWVNKRTLTREELEPEINTAVNRGYLGGKKCSGMNPLTTINSFAVFRGGYRCRHRAIVYKQK